MVIVFVSCKEERSKGEKHRCRAARVKLIHKNDSLVTEEVVGLNEGAEQS